ncbi:MAG: glutamate--tRNA ligase [Candidatus Margulisbacteria bacterium]|nr:glutamate--tRNA ligase [Candidatus Margulisiibacteriota bacterium]
MIITRFAPSPTGHLHIGGARTALFSYLHARHHGGQFLLRMEDTDIARSSREYADSIMRDLLWVGIEWDNSLIPFQSERLKVYEPYLQKLINKGFAYLKDGAYYLKGQEDIEDFVIKKSDGLPTFHFAVVIDDHEMGVNTIIRGNDHLSNTQKHLLLYKYLELPKPKYFHLPLIVDENGQPFSKRSNDTNVFYYREKFYFSAAVLNFLARLGWGYQNQEIFSKEELIELFDIQKISKNPAKLNNQKLNWLNTQYLKKADIKQLKEYPFEHISQIITLADKDGDKKNLLLQLQQKAYDLAELDKLTVPFLPGFEAAQYFQDEFGEISKDLAVLIRNIKEWSIKTIEESINIWLCAQQKELKLIAAPLRKILTGQEKSLDLFSLLYYLGKEEVLRRLNAI